MEVEGLTFLREGTIFMHSFRLSRTSIRHVLLFSCKSRFPVSPTCLESFFIPYKEGKVLVLRDLAEDTPWL